MIKRCGDIRNLHKAVKILWRNVELRSNNEQTKSTASKRKTKFQRRWLFTKLKLWVLFKDPEWFAER
jgi:hypothetical protein